MSQQKKKVLIRRMECIHAFDRKRNMEEFLLDFDADVDLRAPLPASPRRFRLVHLHSLHKHLWHSLAFAREGAVVAAPVITHCVQHRQQHALVPALAYLLM
eukprot:m.463758 g.463758  ORF g.463758 m.463758 type:complete len:101 (+) comp21611_c0_seq26:32-334(+)